MTGPVRAARDFADAFFRGYTILLLWNNPLVGVAVCLGLFLVNPWAGVAALVGNAVATAVAIYYLGVESELNRYGLFGGNGMFIGLAIGLYLPSNPPLAGLIVPVAALASLLTLTFFRKLSLELRLPVLVLPFLVTGWLAAPGIQRLPLPPEASVFSLIPWWTSLEDGARLLFPSLLAGFFRGLGQVLYQDSVLLGIGVFVAWLPRAHVAALRALAGFGLAWAALPALGGPAPGSDFGVWAGTNGALAALCLGGVFLRPTFPALLYALLGALGATWLTVLLLPVFANAGLPIFVGPFVSIVLLFLFAAHVRNRWAIGDKTDLVPVPLDEVCPPENVLRQSKEQGVS